MPFTGKQIFEHCFRVETIKCPVPEGTHPLAEKPADKYKFVCNMCTGDNLVRISWFLGKWMSPFWNRTLYCFYAEAVLKYLFASVGHFKVRKCVLKNLKLNL